MPAVEVAVSRTQDPASMQLRIRRVARVPTTFGYFWYYEIEYTKAQKSVVFFRRYSQFSALYNDLVESFKHVESIPFPPKVLFPGSVEVTQSRRPVLESFLKEIASSPELAESEPITRFLSFDSEDFQSKPIKEGHLKVKESGEWHSRWFELRSGRLSMFEDEYSYRPTVDACLGRCIISFTKAGYHSVFLEIVTDCGYNFQLMSDSPKDIELWGGLIKKQAELVQAIMRQSSSLEKHANPAPQSVNATIVSTSSHVEGLETKNDAPVSQTMSVEDLSINRAVSSLPAITVTASIQQVHADLYALQVDLEKKEADLAQKDADLEAQKTISKQTQEQESAMINERKRALSTMNQGISCLKLSKGKWTRKFLWLSDNKTILYWCDGQQKSKPKNNLSIIQLTRIQIGAPTSLARSVDGSSSKSSRGRTGSVSDDGRDPSSLILTIEGIERALVLKFDSPASRNAWATYLGLFCPPQLSAGN
eukprot:TRINITY_DN7510_c0_g2_i1.p1 TRINITY_DN7510_c0_g2~~TRINITY_DN7510_c0_g2_i1.p1  ORF type:complete len:479 (-),score=82.08 TRINITY_DN7510_c0_g2_i1:236-1672(-)